MNISRLLSMCLSARAGVHFNQRFTPVRNQFVIVVVIVDLPGDRSCAQILQRTGTSIFLKCVIIFQMWSAHAHIHTYTRTHMHSLVDDCECGVYVWCVGVAGDIGSVEGRVLNSVSSRSRPPRPCDLTIQFPSSSRPHDRVPLVLAIPPFSRPIPKTLSEQKLASNKTRRSHCYELFI